MIKYRKDFYDDFLHAPVREKAKTALELIGVFSFEKIISDCKLKNYKKEIRWDFVEDELTDLGFSIIPLSKEFFSRQPMKMVTDGNGNQVRQIDEKPEKFLALGRGKRKAGFITQKKAPASLLQTHIKFLSDSASGAVNNVQQKHKRAICEGLLPFTPLLGE